MHFVKELAKATGYFQKLRKPSMKGECFTSSQPQILRLLTLIFLLIFTLISPSLGGINKKMEMRDVATESDPGEMLPLFSHASTSSSAGTFSSNGRDYHVEIDVCPEVRGGISEDSMQNGEPSQPPVKNRFQFMEFPPADYARPTAVIYTLKDASQPDRPAWDIPTQHMYATDREFFENPRSWKVLMAGIMGGTIGLVFPATPATGGILWSMGDNMRIPVGGALADILITEIMTTMSPVFSRQLYERAQIIARALAGQTQFPPKQKGVHFDNKPHVYPSTPLHTALKGVVGVNAFLEGAYYWSIVGLAEGAQFKSVTLGMGWGLALALAERYYSVGVRRLDHFFGRFHYDGELVNLHRRILMAQTAKALNYLGQYPDFVNAVYDTIQDELQRRGDVDSQHFFALSSLFIRHSITAQLDRDPLFHSPDHNIDESDVRDPRLERYSDNPEVTEIINENRALNSERRKLQEEMDVLALEGVKSQVASALVDQLKPLPKEKLAEYVSIFLTGAGSVSRLFGKQYMFEYILETIFSVDPSYANIAAWCLAGVHVSMKTVQEHDLHQNYMKSWLNTFSMSQLVDFIYLRKSVNGLSLVNGFLFAAANAGPALAKFSEMSVAPSLQFLTIIPGFILDIGYIQTYSKEHLNEIITSAATTHQATTVAATKRMYPQMQEDLIWKRAKCHDWLNKLKQFLETADEETTELFYVKTQLCS